ncbi:hypothetical protein BAMA_10475 [Bacillus manliponensis]|uniref:Lipoprotein n=1 Tax=Bacillus manliponensis TaxID=574376 RepID=A0A073JUQ2_9BACI|nr:hypothetical protein [Bacillus manliponensis]KEK17901.1 hypothetical protein BAMA_10475 [Bacillus manliponensis]
MNKYFKTIVTGTMISSILILTACESNLEQAREGEIKTNESAESKKENMYTLDQAETILRGKLKDELKNEVTKELTPEIEAAAKEKYFKEGYNTALKEVSEDIELVRDEKLLLDEFLLRYQEK